MQDQELTSSQSLEIIHQMINKAKSNIDDNGAGWLLWGTMIFLASIATYFLVEFRIDNIFLAWNIFGLIAIFLLIYGVVMRRKKVVRTYLDDLLRYFDIGFAVCMFVIIFSMNVSVSPNSGFGYLLMIYAFLMLIQGAALKFKPLIAGAVITWVGAIAIFLNEVFKYDMLISAFAVLTGYIIPGLILRKRYRRSIHKKQQGGDGI